MLEIEGFATWIPPVRTPCQGCEARGQALCRVLDCEALAEFKRLGLTMRLRAGQTLFREGDSASRVPL